MQNLVQGWKSVETKKTNSVTVDPRAGYLSFEQDSKCVVFGFKEGPQVRFVNAEGLPPSFITVQKVSHVQTSMQSQQQCRSLTPSQAISEVRAAVVTKTGIVYCHRHDPDALIKSWDPVFVAIGSHNFAVASTVEKAFARAKSLQAMSPTAGNIKKIMALEGCRPRAAVRDHAGRSNVMVVSFPSASFLPEQFFAFENSRMRDAFINKLQVRQYK
jgi:hypothetical protein